MIAMAAATHLGIPHILLADAARRDCKALAGQGCYIALRLIRNIGAGSSACKPLNGGFCPKPS